MDAAIIARTADLCRVTHVCCARISPSNPIKPMSAKRSPYRDHDLTPLAHSRLKIIGIAFCAGLLLFCIVWLNIRRNNEAPASDPAQPQARAGDVTPLPEPRAAGTGASDMPEARPDTAEERPQLVETTPPPQPVAETAPAPPSAPAAPTPAAVVPDDRPVPLPGQSPPPIYPASALRRGDSGTVVVQVVVGVSGEPLDARVIQRSGARDLDRAALDAVRGWRFQPAHSNGQPMQATLDIPFDFKPAE